MARSKAETAENHVAEAPKERMPKRYKVDVACYIEGVYHSAGDIIVLRDESLKASYMHEM